MKTLPITKTSRHRRASTQRKASRRTALGALVLGSAWLGTTAACRSPNGPMHPEYRMLAERLVRLPKERRSLRNIGLWYLSTLSERPAADQIAAEWFPTEAERRRALTELPPRLAEHIRNRTLDDYRKDRVVNVRGWLLSETEARFAALTVLLRRV